MRIAAFLLMLAALFSPALAQHIVTSSRAGTTASDFEAAVTAYAKEVRDWREHQACVEEDRLSGKNARDACEPFPPPVASAEVAASVDSSGAPDFQWVEDGPTAKQLLNEKKRSLLASVAAAQQAALDDLVTPGKWNALVYREQDILNAKREHKRTSPSERKFLAEMLATRRKIDLIQRAAAAAASTVADLTEQNIDRWSMPPLSN